MNLLDGIVLSTFVPDRLRRLYRIPKRSREFELAFAEFYDDAKRGQIIDNLHGARLRKFVDFLDEVLQLDELDKELFRKVLYILWCTCSKRRVIPRSYLLPERLLRPDSMETASGGFASIRKGVLMEDNSGSNSKSVCVKAMKITEKNGDEGRSNIEKVFYEEVSIWMRLRHPNVARCLGATTSPHHWIILDWMQNGEIMDYLSKNPNVNRIDLILGVTRGLDYVHSHGVIHGDVKPNNILINSNGDACLADFGFAIVTSAGGEDPTARGHSSLWAAPETLNEGRISKEADVFSYGLVVVEIFKGEPPWGQATAAQAMTKITLGERPRRPEGTEALGLTTGLWDCLTNCWHTKPEDRITISQVLTFLTSMVRAESATMGASGSELPIRRATMSLAVGTRKSTSTRRRRSSTHSQRSDSRVLPQPTTTSRRSSRHRAGVMAEKLPEATEVLRPKPATTRARVRNNPKSFKSTLKRLICVPSCISEGDMVR